MLLKYGFLTLITAAAFIITVAVSASSLAGKVRTVTIYDDGKAYEVRTMESNVGEILKEANIDISEHDYISVDINGKLDENTKEIFIERAIPVTIYADGKKLNVYTLKDTVAEVLQENGIILSALDRIKDISLSDPVVKGMNISIVRVTDEFVEEEIDIPYQVIKRENTDMSKGEQKVVVEGQPGKRVKTYRLLYEDGQPIGKELIKDETVSKPVNKIIEYGTIETLTTTRGSKIQYTKVYEMTATAYTLSAMKNRPPDHPLYGVTASGMKVRVGIVAVDRKIIPLGTKLYIEYVGKDKNIKHYGFAIAADVGGFKGYHVDLYMNSIDECYKWGKRKVRVYVLRDQSVDIFKLRETA